MAKRSGSPSNKCRHTRKGTNRIGASRLQQTAKVLGVPIEFFFEGMSHVSSQDTVANEVAPGM